MSSTHRNNSRPVRVIDRTAGLTLEEFQRIMDRVFGYLNITRATDSHPQA